MRTIVITHDGFWYTIEDWNFARWKLYESTQGRYYCDMHGIKVTFESVEHFLELDGERSLCLGGDMDGCELLAGGMRGLEDVPLLWQALADRGYPQSLLEDLFWNNLRRLI